MRPIKFRGKRKGGDEILIGDLNHINGSVFIFPRDESAPPNSPDWFEVEGESVGEFTRLKDSKECDIYEGDIVIDTEPNDGIEPNKPETVVYNEGAFYPICMQPSSTFEIIGNTISNPELIQPAKK